MLYQGVLTGRALCLLHVGLKRPGRCVGSAVPWGAVGASAVLSSGQYCLRRLQCQLLGRLFAASAVLFYWTVLLAPHHHLQCSEWDSAVCTLKVKTRFLGFLLVVPFGVLTEAEAWVLQSRSRSAF
eukprot:1126256-Pelagomonas_calceolata.AAC.4